MDSLGQAGSPARHALPASPRDGDSQACAAIPARHRSVRLGEGIEDVLLLLNGDADARIFHRKVQGGRGRSWRLLIYANENLTVLRELDGIANQVDQDLTNPPRITQQSLRNFRLYFVNKFQSFLMRAKPSAIIVSPKLSRRSKGINSS